MTKARSSSPAYTDLLYEALETELGGVKVYETAVLCAKNSDLKKEWKKYLEQTRRHVDVVMEMFEALELDPDAITPGRLIVRAKGKSLVEAMQKALKDAPDHAQVVAAECVVDAETKDHKNWEMIGMLAKSLTGAPKKVLSAAYEQVEDEEDEHLYHTMGWSRELTLEALGLPAELPPPEEEKHVKSMAGEARVATSRKHDGKKESSRSERA